MDAQLIAVDHQVAKIGPGFTISWVEERRPSGERRTVKKRVGYDVAKRFAERHGLQMPPKR